MTSSLQLCASLPVSHSVRVHVCLNSRVMSCVPRTLVSLRARAVWRSQAQSSQLSWERSLERMHMESATVVADTVRQMMQQYQTSSGGDPSVNHDEKERLQLQIAQLKEECAATVDSMAKQCVADVQSAREEWQVKFQRHATEVANVVDAWTVQTEAKQQVCLCVRLFLSLSLSVSVSQCCGAGGDRLTRRLSWAR